MVLIKRSVLLLTATGLIAAGTAGTAHASGVGAKKATQPATSTGMWVVTTPNISFDQAVLRQVTPTTRSSVLAELKQLRSNAANGKISTLPGSPAKTSHDVTVELDRLAAQVSSNAVPATDPFRYPVRGHHSTGRLAWQEMPMEVDGSFCTEGVCEVDDRLHINALTTDPGPATTRFNYTMTYSPNEGHFTNIHVNGIPLCHGTDRCGNTTVNGTGSHTAYVTSSPSMATLHVAHAYELYAYFVPLAGGIVDGAKTGTAACSTTRCVYDP
jgi:hypothetical protein